MIEEQRGPIAWLQSVGFALQWPALVVAAFWLGQYVQKLRMRVEKAEGRINALVDRHMPAVHRALAEIRGLLAGRRV